MKLYCLPLSPRARYKHLTTRDATHNLLLDSRLKSQTDMPITSIRSLRNPTPLKEVLRMVGHRTYAAGAAKKKGSKGGAAAAAPKASLLTKEVKSTTVFGANTLKDGQDPKILPDSEYPDWLWLLLNKKPALSELRRKDVENLPFEDLKRFVKLDNRARIKENNSLKAKN
ncbi:Mitochondrial ribosomal protein L37 [Striga hermonthica]|uniref:Large ribosomal subunit protein mL54 n=1 Tax=Striga hermonthica TaxID=68872 RepID=A0A9N7N8P7_STRHE|nr:Mitochondrial ribosomal protein L37 [Striga hermonthica]